MIINRFGSIAGWNEVTANLFGTDLSGITDVEYNDEIDWENVKGAGRYAVGQGSGNYEPKCSFTLLNEERLLILESLPAGKRIQDLDPFDLIVTYEYSNKIYTDRIRNRRFKNNGVAVKQGDKSISHKFEIVCTHIDYNV